MPAEANEAQRRKRNELIGELLSNGSVKSDHASENVKLTLLDDARVLFINSVKAHSPDKPKTVRRYESVWRDKLLPWRPITLQSALQPHRDAAVGLPGPGKHGRRRLPQARLAHSRLRADQRRALSHGGRRVNPKHCLR